MFDLKRIWVSVFGFAFLALPVVPTTVVTETYRKIDIYLQGMYNRCILRGLLWFSVSESRLFQAR